MIDLRDILILCMIIHMPTEERRKLFLLIIAILSFCTIIASLIIVLLSAQQVPSTYSISADAFILSPVSANPENSALLNQKITTLFYGKKIAIVLGYGCNDEQTVARISTVFADRYGNMDGNCVKMFVFPNDFLRTGTGRISLLTDLMEEYCPDGLVIVGAPEYTHTALAKMQDLSQGKIPYPVVCLFPQDDVLGIEAGSDLVLEYMPVAEESEAESENSVHRSTEALPELLSDAVWYISLLSGPLVHDADLLVHAQQLVGSGWRVSHYIDPETGLSSLNHFIIEEQEKKPAGDL